MWQIDKHVNWQANNVASIFHCPPGIQQVASSSEMYKMRPYHTMCQKMAKSWQVAIVYAITLQASRA
jgi:hypothetical protein